MNSVLNPNVGHYQKYTSAYVHRKRNVMEECALCSRHRCYAETLPSLGAQYALKGMHQLMSGETEFVMR
jgi:hypothetical protein